MLMSVVGLMFLGMNRAAKKADQESTYRTGGISPHLLFFGEINFGGTRHLILCTCIGR